MKLRKRKILTLLLVLPLLIYFWPTQLYGNTSYIMLLGNSMTGTIDSGTLILVQPEEQYLLGDIIAFVNEDGINVVHRILEKTDEGFVTKGDNNSRRDGGIVTYDDILGRAIFVVPYLGYTSLFLKTPLGLSIVGILAVVMLVPRKSVKTKFTGEESFTILKASFATNVANFVMTQIALGINIDSSKIMNIPLSNSLEPAMASTVSFALLTITILVLHFMLRSIDSSNTEKIDPVKLIFAGGGIMILVVQIMSIINLIPFFINFIKEQFIF